MQAAPHSPALAIPALAVDDGRPMADSRDVARTFQRNHRDVLRAYREAHCSAEFRQRNFAPFETKDLTGTSLSHVLMTKNGFAFLVLGFTGAEAGAFKEAYIERFDAMDAELRRRSDVAVPRSLPEALRLAADLAEANARQAEQIAITAPKAAALDRIADTTGLILPSDAAKALRLGPKALTSQLIETGWCFRRASGRLAARQDKLDAGLLAERSVPAGESRTEIQVYVTPKGLTRLARELGVPLSITPDLFDTAPRAPMAGVPAETGHPARSSGRTIN